MKIELLLAALLFALSVALTWAAPELPQDQKKFPDDDVVDAIERRLMFEPSVFSNNVRVTSVNGVVTLAGDVDSLRGKLRAAEVAASRRGVLSVINRLEVNAPEQSDAEIKSVVDSAISFDTITRSRGIESKVTDGIVTISGTVESHGIKRLAGQVASDVAGVRDINNEIIVKAASEQPNKDIEAQLKRSLRNDIYIDTTFMDIAVEDRKVTLSGKIGSLAAKNRAVQKSFLPGVDSVNADELVVSVWLDDKDRKNTEFVTLSDEQITQTITEAFFHDPRLSFMDVSAEVDGGHITLTGEVETLRAKKAAQQNAENTEGVREVKNLITIVPAEKPADDKIAAIVKNALLLNPYTDGYELPVTVKDGEVELGGKVDSNFERAKVEEIVSGVEGVTSITNFITLASTTEADVEATSTGKSDSALEHDIEEEIRWNWFVDSSKIEVEVESGIATLTGTVESSWQRRSVQEDALLAGATDVINNLEVIDQAFE